MIKHIRRGRRGAKPSPNTMGIWHTVHRKLTSFARVGSQRTSVYNINGRYDGRLRIPERPIGTSEENITGHAAPESRDEATAKPTGRVCRSRTSTTDGRRRANGKSEQMETTNGQPGSMEDTETSDKLRKQNQKKRKSGNAKPRKRRDGRRGNGEGGEEAAESWQKQRRQTTRNKHASRSTDRPDSSGMQKRRGRNARTDSTGRY